MQDRGTLLSKSNTFQDRGNLHWASDRGQVLSIHFLLQCMTVKSENEVAQSCLTVTPWTVALQAPRSSTVSSVCSDSCPLSRWCYLTISSSAATLSFCLQSFPSSGSFPMSWLFKSSGQSIGGASALASFLPMDIQGWFPLGLTGWISLQFKGLSRIFSSTTILKHQFFTARPSLWSNSHIYACLCGKPDYTDLCLGLS